MKKSLLFLTVFSLTVVWEFGDVVFAQGPNNTGTYYSSADGGKGKNLKSALFGIIKNHTTLTYSSLGDYYPDTDKRADGKVWDMYSNITNYNWNDNSGNKDEGSGWNKEHSVPQSWFGEASPMKSDIVHVVPTDAKINNMRSNYPYGEVGSVSNQSANGFSKLGTCKTAGYTGTVFEPNDEYKGDFARIYFYMATCYEDRQLNQSTGSVVFDGSTYPYIKKWALDMFLRWSRQDPVSQKEIDRNAGVYKDQKNRNPFVDYPGLEEYIWGDWQNVSFSYDNYVQPGDIPVPGVPFYVDPTAIDMGDIAVNTEANCSFTVTPNEMDGAINITTTAGTLDVTHIDANATSPVEVNLSYTPAVTGKQNITVKVSNGKKTVEVNVSLRAYSDEPLGGDFVKVTENLDDWTGVYLIVYESDNILLDASLTTLDKANNFQDVVITDGTISCDDVDYTKYAVTVTKSGDKYVMQGTSGLYIGHTGTSNTLNTSDSPTLTNTFKITNGNAVICSDDNNNKYYLKYNTSAKRFRYYKSGQAEIQLYRQTSSPAPALSAPKFSLDGGDIYQTEELEITAAEGDIYYSIDGADFVKYTSPLSVDRTMTVTAYAQDGDTKSSSSSVSFVMATTYASLDALLEETPTAEGWPVIVPIQNEEIKNFYMSAGTKKALYLVREANGRNFELYGGYGNEAPEDWQEGDKLTGIVKGVYKDYNNGQWEICLIPDGWNELSTHAIKGDVNGDGVVNITDVVELNQHLLDGTTGLLNPITSDINNDGVINITDIVELIEMLLK